MKPEISVVVPAYNEEKYIGRCINSILNQSYKDFELIIIDDGSTDKTSKIVQSYSSKKIRYFRNSKPLGSYISRNMGIKKAKGEYILYIDGDCRAGNDCLKYGLEYIKKNKNVLGIEGAIYYISKHHKPSLADKPIQNLFGGQYMSGCILYKKDILLKIGGINTKLRFNGDRQLALEVMKYGQILFYKKMFVIHPKEERTIKGFMNSAKTMECRVVFFKDYNEKKFIFLRIVYPINLLAILFPPLILSSFIIHKYKTWKDFRLFLFIYPRLIYERYIIWKTAIREKVFLI